LRTSDAESAPQPAPASADYVERVNRAIDHAVANLATGLRLDDLARVAHFSPFHFHRVFSAIVGETPARFVKRLRLERALMIMAHDPARSLTSVALDCGFASSADFSRAFKQHYGEPPSAFDVKAWRASRRGELRRLVESGDASLRVEKLPEGANPDGFVAEVRELPARTMAYLRVLDPFRERVVEEAAERLVAWAERAGVADNPWYGYMWEDPEVVPLTDCRYDVAVEAPGVIPEGEVGRAEFPPMRVAQLTIRGGIDLEMRALDWLYGTWLPRSPYVPDDQPCFEAWLGRPFEHGLEHFELMLHLPVRRA